MKSQNTTPEIQEFQSWLSAHRKELKTRLTALTPQELRPLARTVIAGIAKRGLFIITFNLCGEKRTAVEMIKKIAQLHRAWRHIIRAKVRTGKLGLPFRFVEITYSLK